MPSPITTHVLNTAKGLPAVGMDVLLEYQDENESWVVVGSGRTDDNGRMTNLLEDQQVRPGTYRIRFDTAAYFAQQGTTTFYPSIAVEFIMSNPQEYYHVPLLVSPFGYSTYRGS